MSRVRGLPRGVGDQLRTAVGGHLGDGLAMSLASGGAAIVGMVSWILAARVLTPTELGTATAFVSAFLLIAGCTEFSVGIGMLRWLPRAGSGTGRLLGRAGLVISVAAGTVASVYVLLPGTGIIIDAVVGPGSDHRLLGAATFVLVAVLYALFQQQDYVLVGLGHAWRAPARTAVFAIGRLGIIVVAGTALTTQLVVASWLLPTAVCVLLVTVQAVVLTRRRRTETAWLPARREVVGFLAGAYVGQVANSLLFNQIPLLMTFRFGPELGAVFFLIWQAVTVVDVICLYFVSALSSGVAREPHRAAELSAATRRQLLMIFLPVLTIGILVAEPALSLFGEVYAEHATVLRLMLAGLALRLLVVHRLGEHQAWGRGVRFGRLAVITTALMLVLTVTVPSASADPLLTFAVGFVVVQLASAVVVTIRRRRQGSTPAPSADPDPLPVLPVPAPRDPVPAPGPAALVSGHPRPGAAVTVAIPVYQGGDTLAETLASVLEHPGDDLEVVVLDNASTDRTADVLAEVTDPRLVVWRNPSLVSMTENHNRAVHLASAPLVKIVSADDLLEPGALADQVRVLHDDPSLVMVAGRLHFVDARGRVIVRSRFLRGLEGTHDRARVVRTAVRMGGNPIGAEPSVLFRRRAFLDAGGYAPDGEMFADLELWLRLLEHGRLHGQRTPVARFRIHAGSRSSRADRADDTAHDRYISRLARGATEHRVTDRPVSRIRRPMVRWRRRALFAAVTWRERLVDIRAASRPDPRPAPAPSRTSGEHVRQGGRT